MDRRGLALCCRRHRPVIPSRSRLVDELQHDSPTRYRCADHGITCSMSRSGNVWDNAAMESFFSSLKAERTARKVYRTRDDAKADVFDYIERFYNPKRRHSTLGYLSPLEFENKVGLSLSRCPKTGSRPSVAKHPREQPNKPEDLRPNTAHSLICAPTPWLAFKTAVRIAILLTHKLQCAFWRRQ